MDKSAYDMDKTITSCPMLKKRNAKDRQNIPCR